MFKIKASYQVAKFQVKAFCVHVKVFYVNSGFIYQVGFDIKFQISEFMLFDSSSCIQYDFGQFNTRLLKSNYTNES